MLFILPAVFLSLISIWIIASSIGLRATRRATSFSFLCEILYVAVFVRCCESDADDEPE